MASDGRDIEDDSGLHYKQAWAFRRSMAVLLATLAIAAAAGYDACPCLSSVEVAPWALTAIEAAAFEEGDATAQASTYGVGCAAHDAGFSACTAPPASCDGVQPQPVWCAEAAWCERQWCERQQR